LYRRLVRRTGVARATAGPRSAGGPRCRRRGRRHRVPSAAARHRPAAPAAGHTRRWGTAVGGPWGAGTARRTGAARVLVGEVGGKRGGGGRAMVVAGAVPDAVRSHS